MADLPLPSEQGPVDPERGANARAELKRKAVDISRTSFEILSLHAILNTSQSGADTLLDVVSNVSPSSSLSVR
jgi:hypothetical protein